MNALAGGCLSWRKRAEKRLGTEFHALLLRIMFAGLFPETAANCAGEDVVMFCAFDIL